MPRGEPPEHDKGNGDKGKNQPAPRPAEPPAPEYMGGHDGLPRVANGRIGQGVSQLSPNEKLLYELLFPERLREANLREPKLGYSLGYEGFGLVEFKFQLHESVGVSAAMLDGTSVKLGDPGGVMSWTFTKDGVDQYGFSLRSLQKTNFNLKGAFFSAKLTYDFEARSAYLEGVKVGFEGLSVGLRFSPLALQTATPFTATDLNVDVVTHDKGCDQLVYDLYKGLNDLNHLPRSDLIP